LIEYIIDFIAGALLGAKVKNSFILALIAGGALNVLMLWSSFQVFPSVPWWLIPFSWILSIAQGYWDIVSALWAFIYGAIVGGIGWYIGKTWLKRWL
jgi:hypothetical protein